jgi:hypothetical protein
MDPHAEMPPSNPIFNGIHIYFGVPAYGGQVTASFLTSWIALQSQLVRHGPKFTFLCIQNESLITRARNQIVARMMNDPTATHLMFIDSDIVFTPDDFYRLLFWNQELVTATYSTKSVDWDKVARQSADGMDPKDITKSFGRASYNLLPNGHRIESDGTQGPKGTLIEAYDATTGFMLIKRQTIQAIINAHPELEYDPGKGRSGNERTYALFDTAIDPQTRVYLSEDFYFCRLWQQLGGKVFVDLDIKLGHVGTLEYRI